MLRYACHLLAWITAAILLGCGVDPSTADPNTTAEDSLSAPGDAKPAPLGIYALERDLRLCAAPTCGGYWVHLLNQKQTPCADGTLAARCYVASVDWTGLGLPPDQILAVRTSVPLNRLLLGGHLELRPISVFKLGVLVASRAWAAASDQAPSGAYYRTENLGLACFAYPCFDIRAYLINTEQSVDVSALDLSAVKATPEQLAAAGRALAAGTLLVPGEIKSDIRPTPAGQVGQTLFASQFYLPVGIKAVVTAQQ
jgi:hypothetical protein